MTTKNLPALDDIAKRVNAEHEACRTEWKFLMVGSTDRDGMRIVS